MITKTTRRFTTLDKETQSGFFHNFTKTTVVQDGQTTVTNSMRYGEIKNGIVHDLTNNTGQAFAIPCSLVKLIIESKLKIGYTETK